MVKKNQWTNTFCLLSAVFSILFFSCTSFDPEPKPSHNLEIGEEVEVASQSISSGGGTVVVNAPGSEIDGMEIDVPPGSYASSRTFKVTTSEITNHQLGEYFNPITPLIQIENGGGYADSVMTVTLPITLPEGEFPIGFFYNEISGSLEGLPLLNYTPTSVTVLTRHLMSEGAIRSEWDDLKGEPLSLNTSVNMLIASVKESVLKGKLVISSGFNPGADDWEFTNLGSYLAPDGHCAGQSMAALWYYYEKKRNGESALFHRFDLLNDKLKPSFMWMDNPLGYRFSSVIQNDFNFDGWINSLWMQSFIPELTFKTFAAAMLVTGEPQSVLIRNSQGQGGHAMIVYKVDYNGGILHIADPNYPNNRHFGTSVESIRTITLENGTFKPYLIGLNAQSSSLTMDEIGYAGKTSYIPWGQIGKRYNEVLDSTIGNVAPNTFPGYRILIKSEKNSLLQNGHVSETDTIRFIVECPTAERFTLVNGMKLISFDMFNEDGALDEKWDQPTFSSLRTLKPGLNKVGFYIYGQKNGLGNQGYFIDFKWFDVYYTELRIEADPENAQPDEEIEFEVLSEGELPSSVRYEWYFGDESELVSKTNDNTATHTYAEMGNYDVTVTVYDESTGKKVGIANYTASIAPDVTEMYVQINFEDVTWRVYDENGSRIDETDNRPIYRTFTSLDDGEISVSGNVYTTTWNNVSTYDGVLNGRMDFTVGANMQTVTLHVEQTVLDEGVTYNYVVDCSNIPLTNSESAWDELGYFWNLDDADESRVQLKYHSEYLGNKSDEYVSGPCEWMHSGLTFFVDIYEN
ncbi:MAG: PKD domain-containing protein [Prolixibacteraceae bacterium]|nr:PKD domain-containing protein [Prolixibacteraceae bacterium]